MDGKTWMINGEALVMMMVTISSNSMSRQGARMEFLTRGRGFAMAAVFRKGFMKSGDSPDVFRLRGLDSRGGREGVPEPPKPCGGAAMGPPCRHVVWAALCPPPSISSSGSLGLRVK